MIYRMHSYQTFEPTTYLHEYYRTVAPDTLELLRFMVTALQEAPVGARVLDFGGGPTLYTAIVAAGRAAEIHVSDYSAANRAAVQAWLAASPAAFDWRSFTETVLQLEGAPATPATVAARKMLVRARLTAVLACDATTHPALMTDEPSGAPHPQAPPAYDVLCTNLCLEAVAQDAAEWRQYLHNIAPLVRPGGMIVLSTVRRGTAYPVGERLFPVASLDEDDVRTALISAGFSPNTITIRTIPSDHPVYPYDGLMLTSAVKATAPLQ